jgi:diketogulonate reductase-like aldo/keto reductase
VEDGRRLEHRRRLLDACERGGVLLEAYSALDHRRHLGGEAVARISWRVERSPAEVLLRWCIQHQVPFVARSTHRERIEQNGRVFDFTLSEEDTAMLDVLEEIGGTDRALENTWW